MLNPIYISETWNRRWMLRALGEIELVNGKYEIRFENPIELNGGKEYRIEIPRDKVKFNGKLSKDRTRVDEC